MREGDEPLTTPRRSDPFLEAASLFEEARRLEAESREAFLRERTKGDSHLRAEVLRLLAHADAPDSALGDGIARGALSLFAEVPVDPDSLPTDQRIGKYRIVRLIGVGGMGTIYEAEQDNPRRRVALKFLQTRLSSVGELRSRFRREAEVLGRLSHAGIARIIEAGVDEREDGEPRPFFAMELVDGLPLLEHAEKHELSTRDRLRLVARICDAVEHAHQLGVVHRDLKPENILVDADGQPKVLDFGVARITDGDVRAATMQTSAGDILGTVPYMSPEQIGGRVDEIDARTDVHALGVLAFELVSGRRPYRLQGLPLPAAARVIQEDEPSQLGELSAAWRGDLDTIVGKALEREKERRYSSAAEMAADIRHFLNNEPIAARPPSVHYRVSKFARRNKALVGGVLGIIAALSAGVVFSTRFALEEAHQRGLAEAREQQALHQAYRASLVAAQAALREGEASAPQFLLDAPEALRGWEWELLRQELDRSVRTLSSTPDGPVLAIAFGADGRTLATATRRSDGRSLLVVEDVDTGALVRSTVLSERPVRLHPEDLVLARRHAWFTGGEQRIDYLDAESGETLASDRRCGNETGARGVQALFGDVAVLGNLACDLSTGRTISTLAGSHVASFSPDGRLVAVAGSEDVRVFEVTSGRQLARLHDGKDNVREVLFILGGTQVATVSWNGYLRAWDATDFRLVQKHRLSTSLLIHAAVSSDGSRIAVTGAAPTVQLWDLRAGRELAALWAGGGVAAFSPDDSRLAVRGGKTQLFDLSEGDDLSVLRGHESYVYPVVFGPGGHRIYSGSWDHTLRVWDAETREAITTIPARSVVQVLSISPDGGRIVGSDSGWSKLWDLDTGEGLAESTEAGWLSWTAEGELRGGVGSPVRNWQPVLVDPDSLEVLRDLQPAEDADLTSPDGAWTVHRLEPGRFELRSVHEAGLVHELAADLAERQLGMFTWSPDGSRLVAVSGPRLLAWGTPSWRRLLDTDAHARKVRCVAYSPDGRLLASSGGDGVVRIWDANSMETLLQLRGHTAYVWKVAWSPDGTQLVSSSGDGTLRVWDSVPVSERWRAREERRQHAAAAQPWIEELFAELGDPQRVVDAVRAATAGESERYQRAALDLVLTLAVKDDTGEP